MIKAVYEAPDRHAPEGMSGEFGELLRQIEQETIPERLLELAVQLQAALQRRHLPEEARSLVASE